MSGIVIPTGPRLGYGFRDEFTPEIHPLPMELLEARAPFADVWTVISLPTTL